MRRIVSFLVILLLGSTPILSAMPAEALASQISAAFSGHVNESHLPRCCRRNGVHHCDMGRQAANEVESPTSFDRFASIRAKNSCPCRQTTLASIAPTFAATASGDGTAQDFKTAAFHGRPTNSPASAAQHRDWPKRGPPSAKQTL